MSEKHIRRLLILGLTVEMAAGIAAFYVGLRLLGWIADRLPAWSVPVGFVAIVVAGLLGVVWDNRHAVELTADVNSNGGNTNEVR